MPNNAIRNRDSPGQGGRQSGCLIGRTHQKTPNSADADRSDQGSNQKIACGLRDPHDTLHEFHADQSTEETSDQRLTVNEVIEQIVRIGQAR